MLGGGAEGGDCYQHWVYKTSSPVMELSGLSVGARSRAEEGAQDHTQEVMG